MSGRIAIMVDDVIDDVQSFVDAATVLKERGAYKIYVLATHGILSKEAPRLIEDSVIDEVCSFFKPIHVCKNDFDCESRQSFNPIWHTDLECSIKSRGPILRVTSSEKSLRFC